jgi:two-component sensor histidine kinase
MALGRAHDALFQADWSGVSLRDIVDGEVHAFDSRVATSGPPVTIKSNEVQALTLVLHELVTNALKYGALSVPAGRVRIVWSISEEADQPCFLFEWAEIDGPTIAQPTHRGLGSSLLQQGVGGGTTNLSNDASGFVYRIEVPLADIIQMTA